MKPETGNLKGKTFLKKLFAATGSAVSIAVIVAAVLGFACGAYALWDANDVITSALSEKYDEYKPEAEGLGFAQLKEMNPEVCGWISIYGTAIDYPVVHGEDNEKYLKTGATGEYSLSGAVFIDKDNDRHFTDFNTIIYGHNMAGNAMFGDVSDYKDESFYLGHQTGNLYLEPDADGKGRDYGLKVLAFVEADAYLSGLYETDISDRQGKAAFLKEAESSAVYKSGDERGADISCASTTPNGPGKLIGSIGRFDIYGKDHLVMLSTCTSNVTNGRHVLICLLTDKVFEDPYAQVTETKNVDTVGSPVSTYTVLWILLIVFAGLVFIATVMARANRVKRQKRNRQ